LVGTHSAEHGFSSSNKLALGGFWIRSYFVDEYLADLHTWEERDWYLAYIAEF